MKRALIALSIAACAALAPVSAHAAQQPLTTDEARAAGYSRENHDPVKKQAEQEARASQTPTAQSLQSVEPAAGAAQTRSSTPPLTTDQARGATY
jgi:hypothetical protein